MLARTLLDNHYNDFEALLMALAEVLAVQIRAIDCDCVQIDEANITGTLGAGEIAAKSMNVLLDAMQHEKAVHFCFGNYGGQTIQSGTWQELVGFLNALHTDHLVLELANRPDDDLEALRNVSPETSSSGSV
tara:strand:- start:214 stop:609 length:396 start_codon:yes stop_codon:yes gene_type:complete